MTATDVLVLTTREAPSYGVVINLNDYPLARPRSRSWKGLEVFVSDYSDLFGLIPYLKGLGSARRLRISVDSAVPNTLLHVPAGLVDGRNVLRAEREQSQSSTTLKMRLGWDASLSALLGSTVSAPTRALVEHEGDMRVGTGVDAPLGLHGMRATGAVLTVDGAERDEENPGPLPTVDLFVQPADSGDALAVDDSLSWQSTALPEENGWLGPTQVGEMDSTWSRGVETRVFNPTGFLRAAALEPATVLPFGQSGLVLVDSQCRPIEWLQDGALSRRAVDALREHKGLVDDASAHLGPRTRARFLLECSLAGIPVRVEKQIDGRTRRLLPEGLCSLIESGLAPDRDEAEEREALATSLVRGAYDFLWSRVASSELPTVSVVMSSMRPEYLAHAVRQFLRQSWENSELLLGLHGYGAEQLDPDTALLVGDPRVSLIEFDGSAVFGDVMRALSSRAGGSIIAKMDDDDWYGRHHLRDLVYALDYSRANLVGSGVQFVYMHAADMTIRRSIDQAFRYGGHPGGPTFMLRREDLLAAGSWPRVRRAIDTGLNDSIVNSGGLVFQGGSMNFVFNRRSRGHTWKASTEYFIRSARMSWSGLRFPPNFGADTADDLRSGVIARGGAVSLGHASSARLDWSVRSGGDWSLR